MTFLDQFNADGITNRVISPNQALSPMETGIAETQPQTFQIRLDAMIFNNPNFVKGLSLNAGTSPIGPAIAVEGLLLQMDNGASPDTFATIANATDLSLPIMTDTVDVTNVGDAWKRHFPTLHDMGKITFKIFWVMEEVTHRKSAAGGSDGRGASIPAHHVATS